jgi:hypothetical protein
MPNTANQDQADSQYNAECLALDTRIPLLDGRTLELQEIIREHQEGKQNWVYSCHPVTGALVPGEISWAGVTRKNAEVVKITLDNGETITCTPDHEFPVQGIGFVRADKLDKTMSLVPFNRRWTDGEVISDTPFHRGYEELYDVSLKDWVKTHWLVANNVKLEEFTHKTDEKKVVVHHADFNKHNNDPSNLLMMGFKDHCQYHADFNREWFASLSDEQKKWKIDTLHAGIQPYYNSINENKINREAARGIAISKGHGYDIPAVMRRFSGKNFAISARLKVSQKIISILSDKVKTDPTIRQNALVSWMGEDASFMEAFKEVNVRTATGRRSAPSWTFMEVVKEELGACNYAAAKQQLALHNHKIVSVEFLDERQDTGCITVGENIHCYHTFALKSGIYTKNSIGEDIFLPVSASGRGSRVETLPGGTTWDMPEVYYFKDRIDRCLRIPSSYMKGQDSTVPGAQFVDGKTGVAYMEERIFANFVIRLQNCVEDVFEHQFKMYLATTGINIDHDIFKLKLPEPQNFELYRQAAINADLVNSYSTVKDDPTISPRFAQEHYLGWSKDQVQMNMEMRMQERGIKEGLSVDVLQQMFNPNFKPATLKLENDELEADDEGADQDQETADTEGEEEAPEAAPEAEAPEETE